jgi:ABC-type branched-subunit amino acid transport system substrate-binding protein/streptogramin lyase
MTGVGTSLAGYRIEGVIGRGGMGVVYRATDRSLGRPVALKLIVPELASDERFRRRFLEESRIAASLDHAHVVPVYEAGEVDGRLFLAMRHVDGADLRTLLQREGRLPPERALALLEQIAGALDAAHRRGLVHRDVKPANILVDGDGHAYLTDFGVSKQLGGVTTDTGRLVGSLDYLAPEQISGRRVEPASDQYALACVLYECLAGRPAFRRDSEAETLWAHMQAQYTPLPGRETVFKHAFARAPEARYPCCADLIAAARAPARRSRRGLALFGAAAATLAAAGALYLTRTDRPAVSTGVVVLTADGVRDVVPTTGAPSNVAVGEGAVWALDSETDTVARIDLETKAVRRFSAGLRPTDLAVGAGAVWVGRRGRGPVREINVTTVISRVDPRSLRVTANVPLSRRSSVYGPGPSEGFPRLAVGAGAVWAIGVDNRIHRIDPATGKVEARVRVEPRLGGSIAAGPDGVWFIDATDFAVARIDPATNRVAERVAVDSAWLSGLAIGGGAVWAASPQEGRLWRIERGRRPQPIDVGGSPSYVGYGGGAVWAADYRDGVVTRVDARTGAVARVPLGAAQALAVGGGAAWVSVLGGKSAGPLPATACGPVESGGQTPDVLIASNFPLRGGEDGALSRVLADAVRWALKERGFRAGRHVVGYQSCDDSTAQTGAYEIRRCAANANAFASAPKVVAVIGPYSSYCAQLAIPILNRAPGGPLALVSPSSTDPGLTRGPPIAAEMGFYPTRQRNFARVIARTDVVGAALAQFAHDRRLARVYLLEARQADARAALAAPFRRAARKLGVGIAGSARYAVATGHAALAARVSRARADAVVIDGSLYSGAGPLLRDLLARVGRRVTIMVGEQFPPRDLLRITGRRPRVYVATAELLADAGSLTPAAERFVSDHGSAAHESFAMHAAQAADVVLEAIERSDGTRASVLRALRSVRVEDGILGSFAFDRYGDMTPAQVTILRVSGELRRELDLPELLEGAVVDRVVSVGADLSG